MSKEKDLKAGNRKFLIGYIVVNCLLFGWLSGAISLSMDSFGQLLDKLTNPLNAIGLLMIPLSIILEGILSSGLKHKIVFLRVKNELPGCRAFTEIAPKDQRIDINNLSHLLPDGLPQDSQEQNSVWYHLYKKHANKTIVLQAHQFFLLTRDLTALTLLLFLACFFAYLFWEAPIKLATVHLSLLLLFFLASIIASRNYGRRFVGNVLVEELSERKL